MKRTFCVLSHGVNKFSVKMGNKGPRSKVVERISGFTAQPPKYSSPLLPTTFIPFVLELLERETLPLSNTLGAFPALLGAQSN